jgi:STAS-like domain of unknown function (DUF4325)
MAITLSIARDFSETPGPRSRNEGKFSGDQFREEHLEPAFLEARASRQALEVDLDGTVGYATSFLEAAFGGLARDYEPGEVLETIKLKCEDEPSLIEEVRQYIRDANKSPRKNR